MEIEYFATRGWPVEVTTPAARTVSIPLSSRPPPGPGVTTLIVCAAAPANKKAGTTAVSWVLLQYCVTRVSPPTFTMDEGWNWLPRTVIVVSPLPVKIVSGETEVTAGTGFVTVIRAFPVGLPLAADVAVTVTEPEGGTLGAA
jgi:hypothetical protein